MICIHVGLFSKRRCYELLDKNGLLRIKEETGEYDEDEIIAKRIL
ncbi:MAG: hypothetical protein PUE01_03130 [Clostridiaceae bacterium]|nr:hypothetical protein [Clostridiaceae bacterium]